MTDFCEKQRDLAHVFQAGLDMGKQLSDGSLIRRPVESADTDADGMDRATAQQGDDIVADLLDAQGPLDEIAMGLGHGDRTFKAQKIRQVQHEHMQDVALNPLAAIEQISQRVDDRIDLLIDAQRLFQSVAGSHLVRDGTNAADPSP